MHGKVIVDKRIKNIVQYIFFAITLVLFAIEKSYNIAFCGYAGVILAVFCCLFAPINVAIALVFYLCPNTYFVMLDTSAICGYLAITCVIRLFFITRFKIPLRAFISVLLLLGYSFLMMVINENQAFVIASVKITCLVLVIALLPASVNKREKVSTEIYDLSQSYISGAVTGAIFGILHYLVHGMQLLATGQNSLRFVGLANDPNYLSATFCFAISLILINIFLNKKISKKNILGLFVLSVTGFITLSRAFIVCFLFIMLYYYFMSGLHRKIKVGYVISIPIIAIVVYILFYEKFNHVFNLIIFRFTDSQYAGGGGRIEVWQWYMGQFFSSAKKFLFGSIPAAVVFNAGLISHIEHNTFIQMLYELGIVGTFIYISSVTSSCTSYRMIYPMSRIKNYGISFLPIIAVIGPYFFLSALTGENFCLAFTFAMAMKICIDGAENRDDVFQISEKTIVREE